MSEAKRPTQVLPFCLGYLCCLFDSLDNPGPRSRPDNSGGMMKTPRCPSCGSVPYTAYQPAPFSDGRPHCPMVLNSHQFFPGSDRSWIQMASCPLPVGSPCPSDQTLHYHSVMMTKAVAPLASGHQLHMQIPPSGREQ